LTFAADGIDELFAEGLQASLGGCGCHWMN
jgi:hypothetical protein